MKNKQTINVDMNAKVVKYGSDKSIARIYL